MQYSTLSAQGCQEVLLVKQLGIRSVSQLGQVAFEAQCRVIGDIRVMADVLYQSGAAWSRANLLAGRLKCKACYCLRSSSFPLES